MNSTEPTRTYIRHKAVIESKYVEVVIVYTSDYWDDGTFIGPSAEILDYKSPHPEIDWPWIDTHSQQILNTLPLEDS